jgi:hypothetical protein
VPRNLVIWGASLSQRKFQMRSDPRYPEIDESAGRTRPASHYPSDSVY